MQQHLAPQNFKKPHLCIFHLCIAVILLLGAGNNKKAPAATAASDDVYYTCSMDPQVISDKPGKCPICKMDLTPVKKRNAAAGDDLELSDQQVQLGNITTDTVRQGTVGSEQVLTATLNFDQTKATAVSARVMGRIEKLYFRSTGDYVPQGAPLYELYSEELNNAKQEYRLALERRKAFSGDENLIDFDRLLQGARTRLLLWGMSQGQINALEKSSNAGALTTTFYSPASGYITALDVQEGSYVAEGGTVVTLADLSQLWAEAQVYTSQMALLNEGGTALVQVPGLEGAPIRGRLSFVNPEIGGGTRINLVRVTIPNRGNQLKPGMPAYVVVKNEKTARLTLPVDAVIRDSRGATAWVQTGPNRYRSRMVTTGVEGGGQVEIISGLSEGDVVVLTGAYLLHSEATLRRGGDPMAGHNHG